MFVHDGAMEPLVLSRSRQLQGPKKDPKIVVAVRRFVGRSALREHLWVSDFPLRRAIFEPYIEKMKLQEVELEAAGVDRCEPAKAADLRSWAWSSSKVGWARLTIIGTGAGFRVANWAAFPRFDVDAPICQAELIEVKGRLFLLVLDALYASSDGRGAATRSLERLGADLRHATPVQERPSWSDGFITPEAIWSRAGSAEALAEGVKAFHAFMDGSLEWLDGAFHGSAPRRAALYGRMRRCFLDNEPSRPFMSKTFGVEWSEAYMSNFLFPERSEEFDVGSRLSPASPSAS